MSDTVRLAKALIAQFEAIRGEGKFARVGPVPDSVADALVEAWQLGPTREATLAVLRNVPGSGPFEIGNRSASGLRNRGTDGVLLVICSGASVPDWQSIESFELLQASDLLKDPASFQRLAEAGSGVEVNDEIAELRTAVLAAEISERPTAYKVAAFLDAVAAGGGAGAEMPTLGAFKMRGDVSADRLLDNLRLSRGLTYDEYLKPAVAAAIRRRAERVLGARPETTDELVDQVMRYLQDGNQEILSLLFYDEATEILRGRSDDLSAIVIGELHLFRRKQQEDGEEAPHTDEEWNRLDRIAEQLRRPPSEERRAAAQELIDFHDTYARRVFSPETRRRLERLAQVQADAQSSSAPEAALARAFLALTGKPERIELVEPEHFPESVDNERGAREAVALGVARMRLGPLLRFMRSEHGIEVDDELVKKPRAGIEPHLVAEARVGAVGPARISMALHSDSTADGPPILVRWTPDLDDVATLRLAFEFEATATLSLEAEATSIDRWCDSAPSVGREVRDAHAKVALELGRTASAILDQGLREEPLEDWCRAWRARVGDAEQNRSTRSELQELALAGCVLANGEVATTPLTPLKAEWLGGFLSQARQTVSEAAAVAFGMDGDVDQLQLATGALENLSASHYPGYMILPNRETPQVPAMESRCWSIFAPSPVGEFASSAEGAFGSVLSRLLELQPELSEHIVAVADGPGAADLVLRTALPMLKAAAGLKSSKQHLASLDLYAIADSLPSNQTLQEASELAAAVGGEPIRLRYIRSVEEAGDWLGGDLPGAHLVVATGLTRRPGSLAINMMPSSLPATGGDVLFTPRTHPPPNEAQWLMLAPPAVSSLGMAWIRLLSAINDSWPTQEGACRIAWTRPSADSIGPISQLHDIGNWVVTIDPYATRDTIDAAMEGEVAILHQARRLGGDSSLGMVISQRAGHQVDRAMARSIRSAGIVSDDRTAIGIAEGIRRVASQGYGILALEAATTGYGINELVGHAAAFSMLASKTTPWPLPEGCRLLLISLDEYQHWFGRGRRADLLALAIDTEELGVHGAVIEVKARRSDPQAAQAEALSQIRATLAATRFIAQPSAGSAHSRLWLNRVVEAAYAYVQESRIRLGTEELAALEAFRRGEGTLEWAGLGFMMGPGVMDAEDYYHHDLDGDRVPIVMQRIKLTSDRLQAATSVDLREIFTAEPDRLPLGGGRRRRRPSRPADVGAGGQPSRPDAGGQRPPVADSDSDDATAERPEQDGTSGRPAEQEPKVGPERSPGPGVGTGSFLPPVLGWTEDGEPVKWVATGPEALPNGHVEVWGASGMGKTQFVMALLAQLSGQSGVRFGVADFKNDYQEASFPEVADARFINLWRPGTELNPLALSGEEPEEVDERDIQAAIINFRDAVEIAARGARISMGHRQQGKLRSVLERAYAGARSLGRWPNLDDVNQLIDDDLRPIIGDLTGHAIFGSGQAFGDAIDSRMIFGLYEIPGQGGLTIVLAAGFILSSLMIRTQQLPAVHDAIRYAVVIDEAHRVKDFKALDTMVREGRSKGLAVILATQQPGDLPDVVAANVQTRVCFRIPDSEMAAAAVWKLDRADSTLPETIRSLGSGEAVVQLGGGRPTVVRMVQLYRDRGALDLHDEGADPADPPSGFEMGDLVAGRFTVTGRLGEGAFATVYSADDPIEGALALKVYQTADGFDVARRELRALRRINHPNVIKVYWTDQLADGRWYVASEFAEGPTLQERIESKAITVLEAVSIGEQLLSALDAIHPDTTQIAELEAQDELSPAEFDDLQRLKDEGIVHRDVKPGNIILTSSGVKLLDFNVASRVGDPITTVSGTPPYQAPDLSLSTWDVATDLYAAGVVLYQMLCGEHPYEDLSPRVDIPPRSPSDLRPGLPEPIVRFLARACGSRREVRYATAREMRLALLSAAEGTRDAV